MCTARNPNEFNGITRGTPFSARVNFAHPAASSQPSDRHPQLRELLSGVSRCKARWRGVPEWYDSREDAFTRRYPAPCHVHEAGMERTVLTPGDTMSHASLPVTGGCPVSPLAVRFPMPHTPETPRSREMRRVELQRPQTPAEPRARPRRPAPAPSPGRREEGGVGPWQLGAGGESALPPAAKSDGERRRQGLRQRPRRPWLPTWPGRRQEASPAHRFRRQPPPRPRPSYVTRPSAKMKGRDRSGAPSPAPAHGCRRHRALGTGRLSAGRAWCW